MKRPVKQRGIFFVYFVILHSNNCKAKLNA